MSLSSLAPLAHPAGMGGSSPEHDPRGGVGAVSSPSRGLKASGGRRTSVSSVASSISAMRRRSKQLPPGDATLNSSRRSQTAAAAAAAGGGAANGSAQAQHHQGGLSAGAQQYAVHRNNELLRRVQELEDMQTEISREREELMRLKVENEKEIGLLKTELVEVKSRNHHMLERLDRVERLENSIVSLYLEVKDRSAEDPSVEPNLQQQRDELKKLNSLVVLDYMRASLRTLLAFKEDYESELRGKLQHKKAENEAELDQLQEKCARLERDLAESRQSEQDALHRMRVSEAKTQRLADESKGIFDRVDADNKRLAQLIREKEDELEDLRKQVSEYRQTIKHKDIRLMRIAQLEAQIQANKVQHQMDLQKLQSQHATQLKKLEKDIQKYSKSDHVNRQLQARLTSVEEELASYKAHVSTVRLKEAETQAAKAKDLIHRLREDLESTKLELRKTQLVAEQHMRKNKDLKDEYDKLFDRVNKEKMRRRNQEHSKIDYKKLAENNPSHVAVYKDRLKEKERECQVLQAKIRKLLAGENQKMLMEKSFELERARYQSELAELKMRQMNQAAALAEGRRIPQTAVTAASSVGASHALSSVGGGGGGGLLSSRSASNLPPRPASARSGSGNYLFSPTSPSPTSPAGGGFGAAQSFSGDVVMGDGDPAEQVAVLQTRNNYLETQLRDFENLKSISVATARAYERLLEKTSSSDAVGGGGGGGGGEGGGGFVVEESVTELEQQAKRILGGSSSSRPSSAQAMRVDQQHTQRRPLSARSRQSTGGTPVPAPNIGSSRSTLRVGSLLGASK